MTHTTLHIDGMHCNGCVRSVTNSLRSKAGVKDVAVSLENNTADVTYDEHQIGEAALKEAIEAAGYQVVGEHA